MKRIRAFIFSAGWTRCSGRGPTTPRKNVIGNRQIIITATQEKMNTIKNRYYIPNNSALILAGDITPARGFALAEQIFADWPRGADPFTTPIPNPPPLTEKRQ